jgi:hypothetical protein
VLTLFTPSYSVGLPCQPSSTPVVCRFQFKETNSEQSAFIQGFTKGGYRHTQVTEERSDAHLKDKLFWLAMACCCLTFVRYGRIGKQPALVMGTKGLSIAVFLIFNESTFHNFYCGVGPPPPPICGFV